VSDVPAPAREDAPRTFPAPRKGPGLAGFLRAAVTSDLPLKALALVLAVMAWLVVREKIVADETVQDVPVRIVVPDTHVVVAPHEVPLVKLRLRGTWNRVARATRALNEGQEVVLRLADLAQRSEKFGTRIVSAPADFTFPFDNPEIVQSVSGITVYWNQLEHRQIPVGKPSVRLGSHADRVAYTVSLDDTAVRLVGPASLFTPEIPSITPDTVDASTWLDGDPELDTAMSWDQGFQEWRSRDPRLRSPRVLRIEPAVVRGKVRFRATGGVVLEDRLEILFEDPSWGQTHHYAFERSPELDPDTKIARLSVLGETKVLERLQKNPDEWGFYVKAPPPPAAGTPNGDHREVPVFLHLPPDVEARLEKSPTVFLTIKPK
jgi:hypothetical protein